MLALLFLTIRHVFYGEPIAILGNDPLALVMFLGGATGLYLQHLEKQEQANQPKLIEKPNPEILKRWMDRCFLIFWSILGVKLLTTITVATLLPKLAREIHQVFNVLTALSLVATVSFYFECAVGYRHTDKPLIEKDKNQAKHLIIWAAIYGMCATTVLKACSGLDAPSFTNSIALLPTPSQLLIPIGCIYAVGLYLTWDRFRNSDKRGSGIDLFAQTMANIGKALIIQWGLPVIQPTFLPSFPLWALQGYFFLMSSIATTVPFLLVKPDIHRKILVMGLNRFQAMLIVLLVGAIIVNQLIVRFEVPPIFVVGLLMGVGVSVWAVYQQRTKDAGKSVA